MKQKSPYRQFVKDCPEHFSKEVLLNADLNEFNQIKHIRKEKSTRSSKSPNKF